MTSKSELKRIAAMMACSEDIVLQSNSYALCQLNDELQSADCPKAERLKKESAALRYVVEKAAEWDPENTDNADLAALGAYARAALNAESAEGGAPKCARCGHTWPEHEATASNILCPDESAKGKENG